jgi:uncharacterized membrane protein
MNTKKIMIPLGLSLIITALYLFIPLQDVAENHNTAIRNYSEKLADAKTLIDTKCMVCHAVKDNHDAMLAPPFAHIKKKYSKVYPDKQDFITAFSSFTVKPSEEKAMMLGAVKQFSVMPNLGYTKEEAEKIAAYVYANDFPEPEWCKGGKGGRGKSNPK